MANGFIELDSMSGGDKIDAESLSVSGTAVLRERVQIAGAAEAEIARVKNTPAVPTDYAAVVREALNQASVVTLINNVTINNSTTSSSSAGQAVDQYREAALFFNFTRSTDPLTKVIVKVEFSDDDGTDWFEDLSQRIEFTDFSDTGIAETGGGKFAALVKLGAAKDFRITLTAEGNDATHTVTATITGEFIN